MSDFKTKIKEHIESILIEKIELIKQELKDLKESSENEQKSSMGDKYETGRERIKQEIDNNLSVLTGLQNQLNEIKLTDIQGSNTVKNGSLVRCNTGVYFILAGLGQIKYESKLYFVISKSSPIGQKLIGLKVGDTIVFNNKPISIENIV